MSGYISPEMMKHIQGQLDLAIMDGRTNVGDQVKKVLMYHQFTYPPWQEDIVGENEEEKNHHHISPSQLNPEICSRPCNNKTVPK